MIFHYNTHACKHVFQQHRLLAWLQYAVVYFSMNVSKLPGVCMCGVSVCTVQMSQFNSCVQRSATAFLN
jgi:hypothetical protein